jgi:hypothetical protein
MPPLSDPQTFRLAPMDGLNLGLTIGVSVIPPGLVLLAVVIASAGGPTVVVGAILGGVALLVATLYAGILVYARPTRFEVDAGGVRVVWPVRRVLIPRADITRVELVSRAEFRTRYGTGMRIGAGGFGGGFGLASFPTETFRLYISRVDAIVLVHVRAGRSWMITPAAPEAFVAAVRALLPPPG